MAALVCVVLMLVMVGVSDGAWCVCRSDVSESALQKSLDYACGAGADCSSIQQGGGCFNPNTVRTHCTYAVNSYYQRKGQNQQACDFSGTATLTSTDPSSNGCTYPASPSSSSTPTGSTSNSPPGSSTPTSTTPGSSSSSSSGSGSGSGSGSTTPNIFTPTTGTGGVLGVLGPSGNSISTDTSDGSPKPSLLLGSLLAVLMLFSVLGQVQGL